MTCNYKIILHFDGTDYCGWQEQDPRFPTIQGEISKAVRIIAKKRTVVTGSSRTDAGVHSLGLTANFHLPFAIEDASLQKALNALLPTDIRVFSCRSMDRSFNARFHAVSKTYIYRLFYGQVQSPFSCRFAAHHPQPLNLSAMRAALPYLLGSHDFSSFTSDEPEKNRNREIDRLTMKVSRREIVFTVKGRSFLRYMVRNLVGTIIDVGRGKFKPGDIPDIFAARDRRRAGQTAPARGLTLLLVEYPDSETSLGES